MKKLILLLAALLLGVCAQAEALPAPFTGYAEKTVFLRPGPAASSESLASIPAGTPFELKPVSETFALVTWQGKTGYVYYPGVLPMPTETPLEPYEAYLPENKYLFSLPLDGAPSLLTVQAETPVTVTGESGRFLRIETQGTSGFVYARDTEAIGDMHMVACETEFWADAAVTARKYPLRHAAAALTLEPGRIYIAEATCNGHYRVTIGDAPVYVPAGQVKTVRRTQGTARAALITPDTALFSAPNLSAALQERPAGTALQLLEPMQNGFQKLHGQPYYIRANDVTAYQVNLIEDQFLRILTDAPLLLRPEAGAPEAGRVTAGLLTEVKYATEDWYLLCVDQVWGFLPRDAQLAAPMVIDQQMMRTAAIVTADAPYQQSGTALTLQAGTPVFLTAMAEAYYRIDMQGNACFVPKECVELLGSDTELTAYSIAAPEDIAVLNFPDSALGETAFVIPRGEKLQVTGFNRCYLIVRYAGQTGYAPQKGLLTAESEGIPETEETPRYELVLNKADCMVYAFRLTEEGERAEVVICAKVGIGKRTTPTPSGTFLLGKKERWHAFTLTYTPHTTEYIKARYIHGWPCEQRRNSTVKESLKTTGMVSGGCLRSPFELARWVYMNCPSYVTELTVVSGGFEAPPEAAQAQVY